MQCVYMEYIVCMKYSVYEVYSASSIWCVWSIYGYEVSSVYGNMLRFVNLLPWLFLEYLETCREQSMV